jgi:hypothetical protein
MTQLAGLIAARRPVHALRVAIDGPDAAGKSTLAAELAKRLAGVRDTILAGVDSFGGRWPVMWSCSGPPRRSAEGTGCGTCQRP